MPNHFIEPGVPLVLFWIFVGAGILIQGISKSGFAGGAGILSLPLMMLVMPVDKVTAAMLPLLVLCDMNAIYHHRRNVVWEKVLDIFLPSLIGTVLATIVWWRVGQDGIERYAGPIKRFVGVIAILFALYIVAKETSMRWAEHHRAGKKTAFAAGIAAGFASSMAHAAGPIVSLYLFSQGLGKTLFVGTVAWTFTFINLSKVPFFYLTGLLTWDVLKFDLWLVPLIPAGSWLGHWMHLRVSESLFNRIIMALTLIAGIQLAFDVKIIQPAIEWLAPR